MTRINWKNRQPTSLRNAIELCLQHAKVKHNRGVERVSDMMGLGSHYSLYKWSANGRLPTILIRPFEIACGIDFITKYIGHSAHKLLIDIPTGRKVTSKDIHSLQAACTNTIGVLLRFHDGEADADEVQSALYETMEALAYHRGVVERHTQPDFDFEEGQP